jgi:hypothetical protein
MADLKLSDLLSAATIADDTFFYGIQGGVSKKIASNVVLSNLLDPVIRGKLVLEGVQLIKANDKDQTISLSKSRTEFSVGPYVVCPKLPNSPTDGLIKIITLANVSGGSVQITTSNSRIYPNVWVSLEKQGESITLMYSANSYSNGWLILGTTPGLRTSILLDQANIDNARIRRAISAKDETINYDEANGTIQIGTLSNIVTRVSLANVTTDNLREGNINFYFSNARVTNAPVVQQLLRKNANILYVSTNGNDSNDGLTMANAVANIHVALSRATEKWTVHVFPGRYTLVNNPVTIPKRVSLMGNDLRTCDIYPANPTSDMFYMNTGAYVNGFTFRGHTASNPNSVKTGAAVFSYNPNGSAGNITTSPYIQNCSSITTTGTGIRVDGNYVGGLKSMVLDAFTQFNEGGIGVHILNQGYVQLVSIFTICCEYAVLCENGGFGSITNSNSSFGKYGLYADGVSPTKYSSTVTRQVSGRSVEMRTTQKPNVNDRILMANYNQEKCFRDTGLIVDALVTDLAYQSNTQSRFSGLQYASQSVIRVPDQNTEVLNYIKYIKTLATNVVLNSTGWDINASTPYQATNTQVILGGAPGTGYTANLVANIFDQYIDIYTNGVASVTDRIVSNVYLANTNIDIVRTANLLQRNKDFIKAEGAAFFATSYPYATYIPNRTVSADTGKIVDSLTFDILTGGNKQMLTRAVQMYSYSSTISTISNQVPQTSGAFKFISTFIDKIINRESITALQFGVLQAVGPAGNVSTAEVNFVRNRITDITNIIENGPTYDDVQNNIDAITPYANTNPNIVLAASRIFINRDFIRAEVLEYVNQNWKDLSNGTRTFYTVNEATNVTSNLSIVTFDEKILAVDRPFANTRVSFHQGSYLQTSGHTFEYVGAGTTLVNALPAAGGTPIQDNEVVSVRGGQIFYTSTDHKGDFRIGDELLISRATGTINGRTFNKSLFAVMTPYILALQ